MHTFNTPVEIAYRYTWGEALGRNPAEEFFFARWDEEHGRWERLPTEVDTERRLIRARTHHFSKILSGYFDLPSDDYMPAVQGFQEIDLFSGAASYAYPIQVPPGRGGLAPNLSLSYSSGSVDWPAQPWDIYARRVDGDGSLLGSGPITICNASVDQRAPAVAYNGELGSLLVTWEDSRNGNWDIYARAVDGGSATMETEFAVDTASDPQRYPDVVANDLDSSGTGTYGAFLVVWQQESTATGSDDIYARRTTTTTTSGATFAINSATNDQQYPALTYNQDDDEYLVVWTHGNGSDDDIHGRRVNTSGGLEGSELVIASESTDEQYPDVAWEEAGEGYARMLRIRRGLAGEHHGRRPRDHLGRDRHRPRGGRDVVRGGQQPGEAGDCLRRVT